MYNRSFEDKLSSFVLWGVSLILAGLFLAGVFIHFQYQNYTSNPSNININDVHKAVEFNWNSINYVKVHSLLDLIYEDPDGKILLNSLAKNKVHIRISFYDTAYYPSRNDISIGMLYTDQATNINRGFQQSKYGYNVMDCFAVLIHEISHAVMDEYSLTQKYKTFYNSKEEELSSTILGINIASRLFRKHDITREEAAFYLDKYCTAISSSPMHSTLPAYNNYINAIKARYNITVPYSDLIYQKIREWHF